MSIDAARNDGQNYTEPLWFELAAFGSLIWVVPGAELTGARLVLQHGEAPLPQGPARRARRGQDRSSSFDSTGCPGYDGGLTIDKLEVSELQVPTNFGGR